MFIRFLQKVRYQLHRRSVSGNLSLSCSCFLQMEWHLSNKCPMIEVICPYAKAGCPFQVWTEHNVINCCIPCGMKFSWDLIFANFTDFKSRKNKLPPKKFRENLLRLYFNEIDCKQCNENDLPYVFTVITVKSLRVRCLWINLLF